VYASSVVTSHRSPFPGQGQQPKLVLVDDHPDILKSLSRMLSFDFDVVGSATDGYQAIDVCEAFDPDIVLLDITMPGRDGFQTARDLRQRGGRARIVFLTMHESEEFVAEAFRSGGSGYVLKTRLHIDLVSALKRVFAGQLFLPSLGSLFAIDESPTGHVAQFYEDDRGLVDEVGAFLHGALRRGDAVSVVSSESIRTGVAQRLQGYGWSVGESGEHGRYRANDSAVTASAIIRNDHVVFDFIENYVATLDGWRVAAAGPKSRLTVVGDISTQVLVGGNESAALDIEHLWNELTHARPFLTVCCYPRERISEDAHTDLLPNLCAEHDAVAHTPEGMPFRT
jgi:CheY-like chemotaxis protein